ncbi:DNA-binding pseudobarrel domain-containing protein [Tanacetum coccineum]
MRLYGVTPTIVLRRNLFKARHVTQQDYGVTTRKVYVLTLLIWKDELSESALRHLRGDQGLHSLKKSTRSPREMTLKLTLLAGFWNYGGSGHQYSHHGTILSIVMKKAGTGRDAVLLRMFPFTLTGSAKRWVDRLTLGDVNTWDLLKKAFIQRYYPPSKTAKRLEDIHNFKQESDESLYLAWERYHDLLYKCPTHDINSHQKWHDGTSSKNVSSSSNTDGLVTIISKLDNLGCNMKKLKENVHAIQVGCQICEGPHLDTECPLNEEVKQLKEVKYGEFRRSAPFNGSNGAKFHVSPPGYYTRTDNRPPFGEKIPSLEELMNKHQEESARRSAKMKEWFKKLQENTEINTRNQSASLKNLETQIEQLTKELYSRTLAHLPDNAKWLMMVMIRNINLSLLGNFTLPCTIGNFNFYGMTDLGASVNVMPRNTFEYLRLANLRNTNMLVEIEYMMKKAPLGRPFLATIHAEIDVFDKKNSLGVDNARVSYDMEKKDRNFTTLTEEILMIKSGLENGPQSLTCSDNQSQNLPDRSPNVTPRQWRKYKMRRYHSSHKIHDHTLYNLHS